MSPDDNELRGALQQAVNDANASVSQAEVIRRFAVLPGELTVEADELTPTLKVRRAAAEQRYAELMTAVTTG